MFIFRWIKNIVVFILIIIGLYMIANYDYQGKPIKQHAREFFTSRLFKDGIKDIKLMVGDLLSTVGEEIKDGITKEDQEQVKDVIEKELGKKK